MKKMIPFILALLLLAGCSGKKQPSAETLDRDTLRAKAFEHAGVANHPGDLGMKMIAERIFSVMKTYL